MQDLLIFPYCRTGIEALDCLGGDWNCIGFISDDESIIGSKVYNVNVYSRNAIHDFPHAKVLTVHGSPDSYLKRQGIIENLNLSLERFPTVIHKNASVSNMATIGRNVLIMAGVVITATAVINDNVIILPNSVVHHDSIIGDCTLIGANVTVAGYVEIGKNCYIGAASSIKNGIQIGEKSLIGIGSNVIRSCPPLSKLVGNPSRNLW
jgi:sugar O-acyltransferase (sialic acid O-acetyltransferase NeuD family)